MPGAYYTFQMLLLYKMSKALYSFQCPVQAHGKHRSEASCDSWDNYICLYDQNKNNYTEFCRENPDFEAPGNTLFIVLNCKRHDFTFFIYLDLKEKHNIKTRIRTCS